MKFGGMAEILIEIVKMSMPENAAKMPSLDGIGRMYAARLARVAA